MSLRLALAGPMAVGKTTTARIVAARLAVPFVDLDEALGSIPARFAEGGEALFRIAESEKLRALVAGHGVLALGGGTLQREENRRALADWKVVILMAREETLEPRLAGSTGRPLADRWRALLAERTPVWLDYGEPVWVDGLDSDAVAEAVVARC